MKTTYTKDTRHPEQDLRDLQSSVQSDCAERLRKEIERENAHACAMRRASSERGLLDSKGLLLLAR